LDYQIDLIITKIAYVEKYLTLSTDPSDSYSIKLLKKNPELRSYLGASVPRSRIALRTHLSDLLATLAYLREIQDKVVARSIIFTESGKLGESSDGAIASSKEDNLDNVTDVGGEETKTYDAGVYKETLDAGQAEMLYIDNFLSRPVELTTLTVASGSSLSSVLDIWDLWSLNPAVRAKLRNYGYFRGDLKIKISVSGTPFHLGRLMVSYFPFPTANETLVQHRAALALQPVTWRPLFLNYMSQQYGRVNINVNENTPVTLSIPFISPNQMHSLFNSASSAISDVTSFYDFENAGSLFIYSINDVGSVSATPSAVSIQVYAWAENVDLGCPTGTVLSVTTESGSLDERETGPVERISSGLTQVSNALTAVPYIAPFARASSMIFGGIKSFAAIFGWSYPISVENISRVRNQPLSNGSNTIGMSMAKRVTLDPKQELTVDPSVMAIDQDELMLAHLAGIESYFTTFSWLDTSTPMSSQLFTCKVSPNLVTQAVGAGANPTCHQPTAMSWIVNMFSWWRGTIKFKFEIVGSAYHRGKLAIIYEPNVTQAALMLADVDLNKQYVKIIDLQETQVFEVCVDWARARSWQQVNDDPLKNYQNFTATSEAYTFCNGYISVVPFTALQSPDNSDIEINVYVSCEDLRVNHFNTHSWKSERAIFTESGPLEDKSDSTEVTCYTLNPTSASDKGISEYYFGEEPLSLRSLLKRFSTSYSTTVSANVATTKILDTGFNVVPDIAPAYGGSAVTEFNLLSYIRYAFLGMKGSIRKRVHNYFNHDFIPEAQMKVTIQGPTENQLIPGTSVSAKTHIGSTPNGTVSFVYDTNGGMEFEIPNYAPALFLFSPSSTLDGGLPAQQFKPSLLRSYNVECEIYGSSDAGRVVEESATGEDFNLFRFIGAPFHSV